jgi:hypothetical protein
LNSKNKSLHHILSIIFISTNLVFTQDKESILKISFNPTNHNFWLLEHNNYGKSIVDTEIEYRFRLKNKKTTYQITFSNAYESYRSQHEISYNGSVDYKINHWLLLGESFIKYNFSDKTYLRFGQYYRDFSNYLNDELSSGSMLVSNNAQAIPKIGLVTHKKIRKNMVLDFGIAHGLLHDEGYYTETPFLHEKFLYLHINHNKTDKISLGFVHEAIWAGDTPESAEYPDSFKDFLKVFISADGPYTPPHANALGSHLGIWDFFYEKNTGEKKLKLYYQHFFEDTSSLRFANAIDGLWGAEFVNYLLNTTVLIEYLDTSNATGSTYKDDYYYWNYQYRTGWAFKDRIIGNPFVNTNYFTEEESIKLLNIGIKGKIFSNEYQIKTSRKIDNHDKIKFKIMLSNPISDQAYITTFLVGDDNNYGLGFSISYLFK